jgi:cation transport ATPase
MTSSSIKYQLLPEGKLAYVESVSGLQTSRSVIKNPCSSRNLTMMCGDGVNDGKLVASYPSLNIHPKLTILFS